MDENPPGLDVDVFSVAVNGQTAPLVDPDLQALADSGSGSDAVSVDRALVITDSSSGADAVTVDTGTSNVSVTVTDSGSGAETIAIPAQTSAVADTANGFDTIHIRDENYDLPSGTKYALLIPERPATDQDNIVLGVDLSLMPQAW